VGLTIHIEPQGANVIRIPLPTDPAAPENIEPPSLRTVELFDATGIKVVFGPFNDDEWTAFLSYLANPEEESKKQEVRSKIAVVHGGALPAMAPSVKGR
jgi:hypothetical protein